ncbi:hypothetical protein Selin_1637 [Desulfurispirillum indicum S5]|uniref:Uncharacterized protein n=1 Tax=Desulfurispirillum indicum (strain ATCC BAA-1389 / DSM 22839 / S5) TaxID=653733 RepID=E6W0E9_DESIS|nr:hypothetical protein Selin_1637 [Desulfurispirillum indicum S5]
MKHGTLYLEYLLLHITDASHPVVLVSGILVLMLPWGNGLFLSLPRVLAQPGRADWNAMDPQGCRHEGGNRKPKAMEGGCLRSPVPGKRAAEKDSTGGRFCATFGDPKVAKETHKQVEGNVKRRSLCRTIFSIPAWYQCRCRQSAVSDVRKLNSIILQQPANSQEYKQQTYPLIFQRFNDKRE